MKVRSRVIPLLVLLGGAALPAMATTGFTPAATEASGAAHAMPAQKSRADVIGELAAWKRNPVSADGWREVGGQEGWVFVGTTSSRSRAEVQAEAAAARNQFVVVDGWLNVGGEVGAVYVGNSRDLGTAVAHTNTGLVPQVAGGTPGRVAANPPSTDSRQSAGRDVAPHVHR